MALIRRGERWLLLLLVMLCSACSCNRPFFYPHQFIVQTPAKGNIDYEDIRFESADGTKLHGWLLKPNSEPKGSVLFLHGNAQNISTHIANIYWLVEHGYEVFMMDYRGYGLSDGNACLPGVVEDVEAAYRWLDTRVEGQYPLFVVGQSLGASLAAYSVGKHTDWRVDGVVLDSPFATYQEIVRDKLAGFWLTWSFQYPLSWMFSDTYSPYGTVKEISPTPLLMFYSSVDNVIPSKHSEKLYESAGQPKRKVVTEATHIATFNDQENRKHMLRFFEGLTEGFRGGGDRYANGLTEM